MEARHSKGYTISPSPLVSHILQVFLAFYLVFRQALDMLLYHLPTLFNRPVLPSDLLEKFIHSVAEVKGPVEWPYLQHTACCQTVVLSAKSGTPSLNPSTPISQKKVGRVHMPCHLPSTCTTSLNSFLSWALPIAADTEVCIVPAGLITHQPGDPFSCD